MHTTRSACTAVRLLRTIHDARVEYNHAPTPSREPTTQSQPSIQPHTLPSDPTPNSARGGFARIVWEEPERNGTPKRRCIRRPIEKSTKGKASSSTYYHFCNFNHFQTLKSNFLPSLSDPPFLYLTTKKLSKRES